MPRHLTTEPSDQNRRLEKLLTRLVAITESIDQPVILISDIERAARMRDPELLDNRFCRRLLKTSLKAFAISRGILIPHNNTYKVHKVHSEQEDADDISK